MTFKCCDICGKELLDDGKQYLFRMDRVPETSPDVTWETAHVKVQQTETFARVYQPAPIQVTIPVHMDLCKECHDDLMAFLETKKKGRHDYHD